MFWLLTGVQDDGTLYPDYDGFRITYPSTTATLLATQANTFRRNGGDGIPPTKPGTPVASAVSATGLTLTWVGSTDNVGVTGYSVVGVSGPRRRGRVPDRDLDHPHRPDGEHDIHLWVYAKDAAGNASSRVGDGDRDHGLGDHRDLRGDLQGHQPVAGRFPGRRLHQEHRGGHDHRWTLRWTFPNGQTVGQLWNGTVSSSGANITVTDTGWNGTLASGASGRSASAAPGWGPTIGRWSSP